MTPDDDNFLSRWSRRKIEARKDDKKGAVPKTANAAAQPVIPAKAGIQPTLAAGRSASTAGVVPESSGTQLPPIDSLTIDSDFTPFLQPGVDPALKREALRKLVRDPRFNVMDGLDVYIDDYSKPDPLPEGWLEQLNQLKNLGHSLEPKEGEAAEAAPDDEATLQKKIDEPPLRSESAPAQQSVPEARSHDSE
jgi:Protein of unknown function (DUF3306)